METQSAKRKQSSIPSPLSGTGVIFVQWPFYMAVLPRSYRSKANSMVCVSKKHQTSIFKWSRNKFQWSCNKFQYNPIPIQIREVKQFWLFDQSCLYHRSYRSTKVLVLKAHHIIWFCNMFILRGKKVTCNHNYVALFISPKNHL